MPIYTFKLRPAILICLLIGVENSYAQKSIDTVIINWNRATLASVEAQISKVEDSTLQARYKNASEAITSMWGKTPTESIRYKFLKMINLKKREYYIIETKESGSKIVIRNFVAYPNKNNSVSIESYLYANQTWLRKKNCGIKDFTIKRQINSDLVSLWDGFNDNDIIITRFQNGQAVESVYFLYNTLSSTSNFKKILDCYDQQVKAVRNK